MAVFLNFIPKTLYLNEGLSTEFQVNLSAPAVGTVTVNYSFQAGTAAGSDWSAGAGTLSFLSGQSTQLFNIFIPDDATVESIESFHIVFSNAVNATLLTTHALAVIGRSDVLAETQPRIAVERTRGDEKDGHLAFRVQLLEASNSVVTVNYRTANGSALAAADYTHTEGQLTFAQGLTQRTVVVTVADDTVAEGWENFWLELFDPVGATLTRERAIGEIAPSDAPTMSSPTLFGMPVDVDEGSAFATVGVMLGAPSAAPVTVLVRTLITGSSISTSDVALPPQVTLTFEPGRSYHQVQIPIVQDALQESAESLVVHLISPSGAVIGAPHVPVTITRQAPAVAMPNLYVEPLQLVDENAPAARFLLRLDQPSMLPVSGTFASAEGTATAGVDFTPTSGRFVFAPGETVFEVLVPLINDNQLEGDEWLSVILDDVVNANGLAPVGRALLADNDATPVLMPFIDVWPTFDADASGRVRIFAGLSDPSSERVSFTYTLIPSGPSFGDTFYPFNGTFSFEPGQVFGFFDLPANPDLLPEVGKSSFLNLTNPVGGVLVNRMPLVTVAANDIPYSDGGRRLLARNVVVDEGDGVVSIEITLQGAPLTAPLVVPYTLVDGSASAGSDYSDPVADLMLPELVFLPGGPNTRTLMLFIEEDALVEDVESFALRLQPPSGVSAPPEVAVTILDNDMRLQPPSGVSAPPEVAVTILDNDSVNGAEPFLSVRSGVLHEGDQYASAFFVLDRASDAPVTVFFRDLPIGGSDFDYFSGIQSSLVIPPESRIGEFRWPLDASLDNLPAQGFTSFHVQITSATNARVTNPFGVVSIAPHGASVFMPYVSARGFVAEEGRGLPSFVVELNAPSDQDVDVSFSLRQLGENRPPQFGLPPFQVLRFMPGETVKEIPLFWIDDGDPEGDEFIELIYEAANSACFGSGSVLGWGPPSDRPLLGSGGGTVVAAAAAAGENLAGPLRHGSTPSAPVTVSVESTQVNERDGFVDVVFRLSAPLADDVTVSYTTEPDNTSSTADYGAANAGTLHFAPGQLLQLVRFAIVDDTLAEGRESFHLRIAAADGAYIGNSYALVTLFDGDGAAAAVPLLTTDLVIDVEEGDGVARLVFTLDRPSAAAVSFDFATVDRGGLDARAGSDFIARSGRAGFLPGQTVTVVEVPILDDALEENLEEFGLAVSNVVGAATLIHREVNVHIVGSDSASQAAPELSIAGIAGSEESGFVEIEVRLNRPLADVVSVSYSDTPGSAGSADYASGNAGVLSFAPGETYKTLRFAVVDDALVEGAESFTVTLTSPVNATITGGGVAELRIDELDGAVTLAISDGTAGTASGPVTYSLVFSEAVLGLTTSGFVVAGGALESVSGSGSTWSAVVSPEPGFEGTMSVALRPYAVVAANDSVTPNAGAGALQAVDRRGPLATSFSPADEATDVALDANFVIGLNEAASFGNGWIALRTQAGDLVQTFLTPEHGGTLALSVDGRTLTVNPSALLEPGLSYELVLSAGCLVDAAGNGNEQMQGYTFTARPNSLPVAAGASLATAEDTAFNGQLPAATDADGQAISYAASGPAASKGTVIVNGDGSYRYTPALNANGSDSFGFSVSDTSGGSNSYTVSVNISAVNDAPVAFDRTDTLDEDSAFFGRLPGSDVDGDSLTWTRASNASRGHAEVSADGNYSFTPNPDVNVADSFTYTVSDGQGGSVTRQIVLSIRPVNDAPAGGLNLTGTPRVLERLGQVSGITDADGLGALTYQWLRDGNPIAGAMQPSYEVRAEDIGAAISLRVRYTDGDGTLETVTSPASAAIAGLPSVPGASSGADTLAGTSGNDLIAGGEGDDTLEGRDGRDSILGGPGNDILDGGAGDDTIDGNDGYDFVRLPGEAPLTLTYSATGRASAVRGGETDGLVNVEAAAGGNGADLLRGFDQLPAERGETLRGAGGDDTIEGGGGIDSAEFSGLRAGYRVERNAASGVITVIDTDLSNGNAGTDQLTGVERLVFADQMLAFGARAEEIVRLAFVLWTKDIVTSGTLFSRGYSFYDVGYDFVRVSEVALQFWTGDTDIRLAERLIDNSGSTKSVAQLLATMAAAGGEVPGRAAALREIALDPATTALIEASDIRDNGVVSENFVPGFGQLFGLFPG